MVGQRAHVSHSAFCPSGSANRHMTSVAWFLENEDEMGQRTGNNQEKIGFSRVFVMENYSLYSCYGLSLRM